MNLIQKFSELSPNPKVSSRRYPLKKRNKKDHKQTRLCFNFPNWFSRKKNQLYRTKVKT